MTAKAMEMNPAQQAPVKPRPNQIEVVQCL